MPILQTRKMPIVQTRQVKYRIIRKFSQDSIAGTGLEEPALNPHSVLEWPLLYCFKLDFTRLLGVQGQPMHTGEGCGMESEITLLDSVQKLCIEKETWRNQLISRTTINKCAPAHAHPCAQCCAMCNRWASHARTALSVSVSPNSSAFKVILWCAAQKSTMNLSFLLS